MIIIILQITLFLVFTILGFIHFNWVFGGKWGFEKTLPTKETGERVLNPKKYDSAIVGLALTSFGLFYLLKTGLIDIQMPNWLVTYGGWIIPGIFILRAIGEFKYLGFFKKIKNTEFGKLDSKLFSPLCMVIGIVGILLQVIK